MSTTAKVTPVNYPHVNPAPWFQVDAAWPKRPEGTTWAAAPGVAVDAEDHVWIFNRQAPTVQVYSRAGEYLMGWGESAGAHYLRFDREGFVWTVDTNRHTVEKHGRDGRVLMTLGTEGEPGEDNSHFYQPTDVAFASNGDIFVSDGYGNARVARYASDGTFIKAWGSLGHGPGQFSISHSIVIDSKDRIYIADRNNARVQVFDMDGGWIDSWNNIVIPWGLWISAADEIWVCGSSPMPWPEHPVAPDMPVGVPPKDQIVLKFDTTGKVLELHSFPLPSSEGARPGDVNWVHGIAFDSTGAMYLGDIMGKRVQRFERHHAG